MKAAATTFGFALLLSGAALSPAAALPVAAPAASPAEASPLLLQVEVGQHVVYPGSDKPAAKAARAKHNAPHYICDKSPERCQ